jgi:predicted RNase H-like HicB family nuclease
VKGWIQTIKRTFNAVIKQDEGWWIGWIQEVPGLNSQGKTRAELLKNLRSALKEALEFNRDDAIAAAKTGSKTILRRGDQARPMAFPDVAVDVGELLYIT